MTLIDFENLAVSVTFWVGLITMVVFLLQLGLKNDRLKYVGMAGMGIALVGSGATLVARGLIAQHAPWSNLWESMITVLFCSLIFYFIVEIWYKPRYFGVVAAPLIMLLIGGASILPAGFKGAAPLMPALQSYWIKVHVLIMLASYAAFTMSFAAAVAYFVVAWRGKRKGLAEAHSQAEGHTPKAEVVGGTAAATGDGPIPAFTATAAPLASVAVADTPAPAVPLAATAGPSAAFVEHEKQLAFFDELTYRLILMGFPLLMIGIITGAMWANGAWGTYWSWDPKETWALITWFVYAAYLHARISRDWTGHKAAGLACLGFASMIVTYIGVNYLSSGLHSYGFIR